MTIEFSLAFIAIVLLVMCFGLLFMMAQMMRAVRQIEYFVNHLDREVLPALRQIEHVIHNVDETVKIANRQILRVEPSLELIEEVAHDVSDFKDEYLTKANKTAVAGFVAAVVGVVKGKEIYDKYIKTRRSKH